MSTRATKESPYKVGQQIHINHLQGEDNRYDSREGIIMKIDGIGQLHGTWGSLAVIPEQDDFNIMDAKK